MPDLMVRCPDTGEPILLHLTVTREAFDEVIDKVGTVYCSHCRQTHKWFRKDVYFIEEITLDQLLAPRTAISKRISHAEEAGTSDPS